MLSVDFSDFSGAWNKVNGHKALDMRRSDLLKSLIVVGYPSRRRSFQSVGILRARMFSNLVQAYVSPQIKTTQHFKNLEASEKTSITFLLAEGLTHFVATTELEVLHLVHVGGLPSTTLGSGGPITAKHSKFTLKGYTIAAKTRPDFVGRHLNGLYSIFESKGRTSKISSALISKALSQVVSISSVNANAPVLAVAACFSLLSSEFKGEVVDPVLSGEPSSLDFDPMEEIYAAYQIFLDDKNIAQHRIVSSDRVSVQIDPGLSLCIDRGVYDRLPRQTYFDGSSRIAERKDRTEAADKFCAYLQEREKDFSQMRVGGRRIDRSGIFVEAPPEFDEK